MNIRGGRAGLNSVSFAGDNYYVISRLKKGQVVTKKKKIKKYENKLTSIIDGIPFVRSLSLMLRFLLTTWKVYLFGFLFIILSSLLFKGSRDPITTIIIQINDYIVLIFLVIGVGLVFKVTSIAKYHAAEHMVANAYVVDSDLTVDKVRVQPRTHNHCGTNLVVTILFLLAILHMFFGSTRWIYLGAWVVGYEIWRFEPKFIWTVILAISKTAQYILFTSPPSDKHIVVAMAAMQGLEKAELKND
ncbi:hypothetical protein JNUCC1_02465 [Lentibacillus sp. JNUCC-1]|uniref:DUF1385 domain-containing protein n=1 Tax=Lentibacillus sp. JNUCC-1 TaxID=2654513 RepID=UPI0012E8C214|nr:DUF1385 domain-containing protein [Lentibacillus sp. JNUCC-1]MUV38611.1 hypothetical protein [Lentibacillus sp. JNUCC-1]